MDARQFCDSRRAFLAAPAALLIGVKTANAEEAMIQYGSGSFTSKSLVNGVLSAYGLPQFADTKGYTPFLQQFKETIVEFSYPSSWVVNNKAKFAESGLRNGMRSCNLVVRQNAVIGSTQVARCRGQYRGVGSSRHGLTVTVNNDRAISTHNIQCTTTPACCLSLQKLRHSRL